MKSSHPIDEIFRSKLSEHTVEAPMHLWDNIEAARKKKSGFVFKPWHFLFITIFVLGGSLFMMPFLLPKENNIESFPIPLAPPEP